jgi:FAD/FMN-containing dehydrogenase
VPEHDDVLLSTERVRDIGEVDVVERRVHVGAGATLADVQRAAAAVPVLFGHIGEGTLHLNVVRCGPDAERQLYSAMMELIARRGGNVSSEHGIGTRKRDYVSMSRTEADIAAMRAVKAAFDPTGYLNPAVLFG